MPNNYFQFKQFTVWHDRCAMKVGTDGVLLGAVAGSRCAGCSPGRILDIGTGTGLVALMMAQQCQEAQVVGIDIDEEACRQAMDNVGASPFASRVRVVHSSLADYVVAEPFDVIVCNPPFYEETLMCPDGRRNAARHTASLPFRELMADSARLMKPDGNLFVIVPTTAAGRIEEECAFNGLFVTYRLYIKTVERKEPKRVILQIGRRPSPVGSATSEMRCLMENGQRSDWYSRMCENFYL